MSRKRKASDPHGWHALDNYLHVQARRLQDFRDEGFLLEEHLVTHWLRADRLIIEGRLRFQGGLFLDVETSLAARLSRGSVQVRIVRYAYHAGIEGSHQRSVFRYDNHHAYTREGHPDAHHKHIFDHNRWSEHAPPVWIGERHRPHLSEVIEELRQWWEDTGRFLDLDAASEPA